MSLFLGHARSCARRGGQARLAALVELTRVKIPEGQADG
jgi:hypothetical protein